MIMRFLENLIKDTKHLKILVVSFLVLLESITVISAAASLDTEHGIEFPSSVGIIGGADGPTKVFISGTENKDRGDKDHNQPTPLKEEILEATAKGLLILINKENPVSRDYKPDDLVPVKYFAPNRSEAGRYMREEAAEQFHKLVEAAAAEGHEIVMTTAYRSYGFQQILWDNYVANEGEAAASRFSARPGQSEHQSGLAVDVSSPSVEYDLTDRFGEIEEGMWLAKHAHSYGFIIRFPKDREDITGYMYEPWHIRYVGEIIASEIYEKDITLEEFLDE